MLKNKGEDHTYCYAFSFEYHLLHLVYVVFFSFESENTYSLIPIFPTDFIFPSSHSVFVLRINFEAVSKLQCTNNQIFLCNMSAKCALLS